jgi:hypothetical protein
LFLAANLTDGTVLNIATSEFHEDDDGQLNYLIMYDLPSDKENFLEEYIHKSKLDLSIARGARLIQEEEEELQAKKEKPKKNRNRSKNKKQAGESHIFLPFPC